MIFTDSHTHLHFPDYQTDLPLTLQRAREKGVKYLVNVGTNLECSGKALDLAEGNENIYAAVGCHPHDAKDFRDSDYPKYQRLVRHPKAVAIGEVGLDFYRNLSPPETQEKVFRKFLELHKETGLALVLHIRDAHARTFQILEEELKPPIRGVLHCFSGDLPVLGKALTMGLWISFAGNITYKKNDFLRQLLPHVPKDKMILETDSPFLPPEGFRGKRNEPAYVLETGHLISQILGISLEELGFLTSRNAASLFGFPLET